MNESDKRIESTEFVLDINIIFEQLMETIRTHGNIMHSWIKTLLAVEGGCVIALAYILKDNGFEVGLANIAVCGISIIGIVGAVVCCEAIDSVLKWQGRYITYVKKIDSTKTIFNDIEIVVGKRGIVANLVNILKIILIVLWLVLLIFILNLTGQI